MTESREAPDGRTHLNEVQFLDELALRVQSIADGTAETCSWEEFREALDETARARPTKF